MLRHAYVQVINPVDANTAPLIVTALKGLYLVQLFKRGANVLTKWTKEKF